jgi:hypothetical protein
MTERIDVYYSRINLPQWAEKVRGPVYHKYLIYTDKGGQRRILRAGPSNDQGSTSEAISPPADPNSESSYGPVRFYDGPFEGAPEYQDHSESLGELLFKGDDLSQAWRRMQSRFHEIEGTNYRYWPQGVNSNTIVDATLARSGYHPTYRDGTAGNDDWVAPDGQDLPTISTPGYNRLPPPPGYYEKHRKPRAIGRGRSRSILPTDLLEMSDGDFARATDGPRWRAIWQ